MVLARIVDVGPRMRPEMYSIARELEAVANKAGYSLGTIYGSTTWPDHSNLRCLDLMISRISGAKVTATDAPVNSVQEKELGTLIADYVWAHRIRLRLNWQIWRGRIRRTWTTNPILRPTGVWAPYFKPLTHFDHVHVEVQAGDYRPPPEKDWWHVNPAKVSTWLWGLKNGTRNNIRARPGRNIAVARWVTKGGRRFAVTAANNWFDARYLKRGRYREQ